MARLVPPLRLELKRRAGSFREAPLAKVIFTMFLYVSPVQMIPSWHHTGTPSIEFDGFLHFTSSAASGSASLIRARSRESISPLQSSRSSIIASITSDEDSSLSDWLFPMLPASPWPLFSVCLLPPLSLVSRRLTQQSQRRAYGRTAGATHDRQRDTGWVILSRRLGPALTGRAVRPRSSGGNSSIASTSAAPVVRATPLHI